jgi:hypothetical protein
MNAMMKGCLFGFVCKKKDFGRGNLLSPSSEAPEAAKLMLVRISAGL